MHVLQDQRADQSDSGSDEGEGELIIISIVMPIMSKPAMSSVVKDMGESSSMNNLGCT